MFLEQHTNMRTHTLTHTSGWAPSAWMRTVWVSLLPAVLYHAFREQCCQLYLISIVLLEFLSLTRCLLPGTQSSPTWKNSAGCFGSTTVYSSFSRRKKDRFIVDLCRNVLHLNNRSPFGALAGTCLYFPCLSFPLAGNISTPYWLLYVHSWDREKDEEYTGWGGHFKHRQT